MNGLTDSDIEDDFVEENSPSPSRQNIRDRVAPPHAPTRPSRTSSTPAAKAFLSPRGSPLRSAGRKRTYVPSKALSAPPSMPPPDVPARRQRIYNPFDNGDLSSASDEHKGNRSPDIALSNVSNASTGHHSVDDELDSPRRQVVFSSRPSAPRSANSGPWLPPTREAVANVAAAPSRTASFFERDDARDVAARRSPRQKLNLQQKPPSDKKIPPREHAQHVQSTALPQSNAGKAKLPGRLSTYECLIFVTRILVIELATQTTDLFFLQAAER